MADVVTAALTVVAGVLLCTRGCAATRLAIPTATAVGTFLLAAGIVHTATGASMLGSVATWSAGLAAAVLAGLAAWLWFEVAVALALTVVGFCATVAVLAAIGAEWSVWVVSISAAAGLLLGLLCVIADLPAVLLTVLTAVAGAALAITGALLLGQSLGVADLTLADTMQRIPDRVVWVTLWAVLAIVGIAAQSRTTPGVTLRDRFVDAGGRQLRET